MVWVLCDVDKQAIGTSQTDHDNVFVYVAHQKQFKFAFNQPSKL